MTFFKSIVRRAEVLIVSVALFCSGAGLELKAQNEVREHAVSTGYEWPSDSLVLEKLDRWQDLKFGVLFHWGLYSLPGIVESWSICSEDVDWISRRDDLSYEDYKKWYWGLKDSLAPVNFDPGQWAEVMAGAGMKYMIFTTKHHDGFCTFDSRYTDFSIAHGAFSDDPRKDVARLVFDVFREKDFMVGCYFSKPDWHCKWFWNDHFATPDRHENYKREVHPQWWDRYVEFTRNQLTELMTGYGKFDILWLDGGWVSGEEIGLDSILETARKVSPGMLSVDRTIKGPNENYQTPERGIPQGQLDVPWESCIPLSNDWGWVPDAPFKSPYTIIGQLAEITAKGGSLLLGVGPTADGVIQPEVVGILGIIGEWLRQNGEAIYGTRTTGRYHDGDIWFTASKDGKKLYAIYPVLENGSLPEYMEWEGNIPGGDVILLSTGKKLKYSVVDGRVRVKLPKGLARQPVALSITR